MNVMANRKPTLAKSTSHQTLMAQYELEKELRRHKKNILPYFKKILAHGKKREIILTYNPGILLYTPQEPKNIKSSKNILIIIHELSRTGAPTVAIEAAKTLSRKGYYVTVLAMRRGPLLNDLLDYGIPVVIDRQLVIISENRTLAEDRGKHFYVDSFIISHDCTIMVTAVYRNLINRYLNDNSPIIWWIHEGKESYKIFGKTMPREITNNIKVYTGGQYAQKQLKEHGFLYKPKILNYGVHDAFIETTDIDKPSSINFLFPASITERKGQDVLLDAIDLLPRKYHQKASFIFIGDINSDADLQGKIIKKRIIAAKNIHPNLIYKTSMSKEELFEIYKQIQVLVVPSIDDPMPVVATEAFMLKKVVLCSDSTGTSYYLKDGVNGYVFKSKNARQLCDKIKTIIDNPHLDSIGKKGREIFENNFSIETFEKHLINIIEANTK